MFPTMDQCRMLGLEYQSPKGNGPAQNLRLEEIQPFWAKLTMNVSIQFISLYSVYVTECIMIQFTEIYFQQPSSGQKVFLSHILKEILPYIEIWKIFGSCKTLLLTSQNCRNIRLLTMYCKTVAISTLYSKTVTMSILLAAKISDYGNRRSCSTVAITMQYYCYILYRQDMN